MKLYGRDSRPGSRRVGIFLAEKGLSMPTEPFDPQIIDDGSGGLSGLDLVDRVPALELDDGTMVCCRSRKKSRNDCLISEAVIF